MSFLNSISRALGFGGNDEEDDIYTDTPTEAEPAPAKRESAATADTAREVAPADDVVPMTFDPATAGAIFDRVLEVFNASLPDFLQKSVDPEAQRKALADAMDESIKQYMAGLGAEAERVAESRLRNASDAARSESERLRKEMEQLEQQKVNLREQQLSADRRRRALQDRVKDLEEQIGGLEAEREQFQLENRSLLNKLKLADVQPGVIDELKREIERLQAQGGEAAAAPSAELESLKKELEEAKAALAGKETENEQLAARIAELESHQADVQAGVDISKQMYTEIQEQLTGERQEKAAVEAQLQSVREELEQAKGQLAEAEAFGQSVKELETQLSTVEAVIAKRDERIASLKSKNKKLKEELAAAKEQAMRTNDDSKGLFALADVEQLAGDDDFECPDWFVSEPGPDTPPLHPANSDFGYTEPPRKPKPPESDAQLSLF